MVKIANASSARIPPGMVYAPMEVPSGAHLEVLEIATLPPDWFEAPAPLECQLAGDAWVRRGESVGLVVPSAVARIETNVLLNPANPDFARILIGQIESMAIDRRLVG